MQRRFPLHFQILLALGLALAMGALAPPAPLLLSVLDFVGTWFLRALKMLVLPLIVSSIVVGITSVGSGSGVGRLGLLTAGLYMTTSLVAIFIGLSLVSLVQPGIVDGQPARELIGLSEDAASVVASVKDKGAADLFGVLLRMIPENVFADAAAGEMLSVIVFSLLFGALLNQVEDESRVAVVRFFRGVEQVMLRMTELVLAVSPVGVFALVGKVALSTGWSAVLPLLSFVATVLAALFIHAFLVVPLLLLLLGKTNPRRHYKTMAPALLMAFSTASSSGTLPVTMDCVGDMGVSRRVSSFTLPLGATVNMDGTALYECVAAVFIAQAYGVSLGFSQLFLVALVALLTSVGVAGIPAASLVAISLILSAMGLPLEGLGLILAVDRVLDMARTSVNVLGDSAVAVIVARLSGDSERAETDSPGGGESVDAGKRNQTETSHPSQSRA